MNVASFPLAARVAVPTSHWDGALAVDLFGPDGTPVLAVFDGTADAYAAPLGGNAITLTAADGTAAYYAHLAAPGRAGAVRAGDVLGYEGHTGNADKGNGSSDSHLHFAVASSPGVIAALDGAGDLAPWDWLAGATAPSSPAVPGAPAAPGRVRWGPILVLGALVLAALAILDD